MLPLFKSVIKELELLQTRWKSELDPLLAKKITQGLLLKNVSLEMGSTAVNHLLGRKLVGWEVVRKRSAAELYDTQDSNPIPELTLILVSDADVEVDLWVF